ncbi:MAG TPA: GNAT family protein [Kofleriaceae bacterium]|jgi:RimJ/RimL family protein N-acetyltransferase|nr:GNAT family protein [Kofleriaceae bacterium]
MIAVADIGPATPTLETERLALRELRMEDAHAIAMRAGDKDVARFLIAVPSPYPVALAARWITARIAWWPQGRGVTLAITKRATPNELLGTVSLRRYARDRRAELGYWLGMDAWGQGYATEAADALVDLGFSRLGLSRIYAQVLDGNDASCRVLEKLGMLSEGVRRAHVRKGKRLCDVHLFGMLRDEWRDRR